MATAVWKEPKPASRALQYLALVAYLLFLGFPLVWMLSISLKGPQEIGSAATFFPRNPTFENFTDALQRADLLQSARNSFLVALATTVLVIIVALPASYALARFRTRFRGIANGWILVSQVFPVVLIIIPLFLILQQFNLDDRLVGLTIVYVVYSLPFGLWMLQGYVASIPRDVEEAGAIDGAGRLRILRSIVLPLLVPGVVATAMFTLISSWNEFFFALVLIQSPENSTLPLTLARFVGAEGQVQLGALAAGSLIATIPSLIFFSIIQRRLTSGLLSGAVKG